MSVDGFLVLGDRGLVACVFVCRMVPYTTASGCLGVMLFLAS